MTAANDSRDRPADGAAAEADDTTMLTPRALAARFGRRSPLAARGIAALRSALSGAARDASRGERFLVESYFAAVVALVALGMTGAGQGAEALLDAFSGEPPRRRRDVAAGWFRPVGSPCGSERATVFPLGPFDWWLDAWNDAVETWLLDALEVLGALRSAPPCPNASGTPGDLFRALYEDLVPQSERHRLGEYYTPDWLAAHVLDQVGYLGRRGQRLIDPTCGSGVFLVAAIRRVRAAPDEPRHGAPEELCQSTSNDPAPQSVLDGAPNDARQDVSQHSAAGDGSPAGADEQAQCRLILRNVVGLEIQPAAVLAARANFLIALGPLARWCDPRELPIAAWDAVLDVPPAAWAQGNPAGWPVCGLEGEAFDFVVGNPPWIAWDRLPDDYRAATAPLWRRYGLFSLSAREARYGGAKKDLCALVVLAAADRYLRSGGCLGMVVTQTLFQTKGAGDGFRRFRIGSEGVPLGVLRVDDLTAVRPFPGAANRPSVVLLRKGEPTTYPVPYVRWLPDGARRPRTSRAARSAGHRAAEPTALARPEALAGTPLSSSPIAPGDKSLSPPQSGDVEPAACARREALEACPIAPLRPGSPWLILPPGVAASVRAMLGRSDYRAQLGANSGGANGVYWLEPIAREGDRILARNLSGRGWQDVEPIEAWIEAELVHPLLRWGDVGRFHARPSAAILIVQDTATRSGIDPERMRADFPLAHAYLARFEALLRRRSALRRYQREQPFYSMYNVGPVTFSPIKVVWRRMDRAIRAAVVEPADDPLLGRRTAVPQETCALVACDSAEEAHYLCALLNSRPVHCVAAGHQIAGGKGFGTPGMLDFIALGRFDPADPRHRQLAECSRRAHAAAAATGTGPAQRADLAPWLDAIDRLAASLWQIPERALAAMRA